MDPKHLKLTKIKNYNNEVASHQVIERFRTVFTANARFTFMFMCTMMNSAK